MKRHLYDFGLIGVGVVGGSILDTVAKTGWGSVPVVDTVLWFAWVGLAVWARPPWDFYFLPPSREK